MLTELCDSFLIRRCVNLTSVEQGDIKLAPASTCCKDLIVVLQRSRYIAEDRKRDFVNDVMCPCVRERAAPSART